MIGNKYQNGGALVVEAGGEVIYNYKQKNFSAPVEIDVLLKVKGQLSEAIKSTYFTSQVLGIELSNIPHASYEAPV